MTNNYRPRCREDFHVAVICALPLEYDAVALAFDEFWNEDRDIRGRPAGHDNYHKMGRIGSHNAVLVLLPNMGKVSAANETARLRLIYTGLKLAILTGICGGVPSPGTDDEILLGDIVISNSIVQYDLGRQYPGKFSRKDTVHDNLGRPSKDIRTLLAIFETHLGLNELQCRTIQILKKLQQTAVETNHRTCYDRPADGEDTLFKPDYPHRHRDQSTCSCDEISACDGAISASCEELQCNVGHRVLRRRLESKRKRQFEEGDITNAQESRIHIGRIGSGDTVMKSGEHRDRIAKEHSIIAFEMEGAGVWDEIPCVIVKAVCDYADSHKNKRWQDFAAATAASAMKALLEHYIQRNGPETAHTWFLVPYNENPGFVGRSEILDQVKRLFGHDQNQATVKPCSRVALYGLGGVGKTQIALAYVYWMKETHPGVSVFWVHASNAQRFRQAFASIAEECNIPGRDDPKADALLLVRKWLETKNSGQWLMVIDNADDTHLFSQIHGCHADMSTNAIEAKHNLGRYVPECAHGLILITTRNKQTGSRLAPGRPPIRIDSMSNDEADQLLRSMLEEEVNIISTEETLLLSSRLENLPLALAQAAAFILENDILINDYVQLLSESDSRLVDCLSEPFEAVGRDSGTPHALTATWIISSFEQIERQNAFASDVLSLLSLFDRQAIPKIFINNYYLQRTPQESEASQAAAVTKALGILKAFSFIKESKHQSVDMHRLVQMVTRKWLVNSRRMTEFAQQALRIVSNTYPYGKHESKEYSYTYQYCILDIGIL
ncbi:uncharacterized protein BCR38DRAFT_410062 [Pseudomassariella vexata]|uniref:Nucleoside phosphorylase domain-containing protein n=1 Tax=Pseudomassariella vexata TaxID=1141098 RepID=A0A1Y2DUY6_9PEZI|nr:uncharacterized protein BCR38DRAFT_410062 [Pseudomassariella vexata]ORY63100.1 hypothetical protein BCR38DRAFT_410062 [Pseudomassariella vexata]